MVATRGVLHNPGTRESPIRAGFAWPNPARSCTFPHMRTARLLPLAFLALSAVPAAAAPVDDRALAFDVLEKRTVVERRFSNCRWIRGIRDDALLQRWKRDNKPVVDAAMAVIEAQGGLTETRRRTSEGLAEMTMQEAVTSRDSCKAFLDEARQGAHDLTTVVPAHTLKAVFGYAEPKGEPRTWAVEQRRQPTGVLAWQAKPWTGEGGLEACEASTVTRPHIFLRRPVFVEDQPQADPDPNLWFAECLSSPVDPVTGRPPHDPS